METRGQGDGGTGWQGGGVSCSVVRVLRCGLRLDPAAHKGDGQAEVGFCFDEETRVLRCLDQCFEIGVDAVVTAEFFANHPPRRGGNERFQLTHS